MAVLALAIAGAWIALQVAAFHRGHINGLFWTGQSLVLPASVGAGHVQRVNEEHGYDGQFYRLVARDPVLLRGLEKHVDNSRLRWRRIGVPGLTFLIALGSDAWVDRAYVAIELAFVLLGAFWLARLAERYGRSPALGLAFFAIPAVPVSLERMTVDLPLAALAIAFVLYSSERPSWRLYAVLAAAPLVRETGMLLVAAWCLHAVLKRQVKAVASGAACAIPAVAWWAYVHSRTPADGTEWLSRYPFSGLIEHTLAGSGGAAPTLGLRLAAVLETAALAGIWLAILLALHCAWKRRWGIVELTAIVVAAFAAALGKADIWSTAYAAGRTMSPLLVMLGIVALRDRRFVYAAPVALILPRIALQCASVLKVMLRG